MTFRGHIHNGAIVLDRPTDLPEGAAVELEIKNLENTPSTLSDQEKSIEELTQDISYDFAAFDRLRQASKM